MVCGIPKKIIQRYFFKFKIPLRYTDIQNLIDTCATDYDVSQFPKRYTPETLIAIKRSLEVCRRDEGIMTKKSAEAESNLLDAAADMGDRTAIALLCGARLRNKDVTTEEMDSGSDLLKQLMDQNFPLAFKISGDLAFLIGQSSKALQFYKKALDNQLSDKSQEIECLRNMGYIYFKNFELIEARECFMKACDISEESKPVSDCHFMLAQLCESDRILSRKHLEIAAGDGLHDAFPILGNLLLNFFGEARLAREWFKLAITTDVTGKALIGLLDVAIRLNDNKLARQTILRIESHPRSQELIASRKSSIEMLRKKFETEKSPASVGIIKNSTNERDRFNF